VRSFVFLTKVLIIKKG